MKAVKVDRIKQLQELRLKLDEHSVEELNQLQNFEDEVQTNKSAVLSADDSRKAVFQLAYDEDQQIVAVSVIFVLFSQTYDFTIALEVSPAI